ncbi:DUF6760 family protein [Agathobaculum sp. NTUH-O15-33]|uniref:DUF6760 family protein n=1 Tax=Butyricicoccaceae TaxID=3085642 RepID=UPI002958A3B8|nr:DUF6760 family protein [Agathobaculum sp. NTUH-O15-33]WNX86614.1 DUF6760 family protein [Agathobaculum sp. NTUH-O15-33]
MYGKNELYRQMSFICYYFHWSMEQVMALSHLDRRRICDEIGRINREISGESKNIFEL